MLYYEYYNEQFFFSLNENATKYKSQVIWWNIIYWLKS